MKKHLLLILLAVATASLHAQSDSSRSDMYKFLFHDMGEYQINIENAMRQSNGEFFINLFVGIGPAGVTPTNIGNIFYKMSPSTLSFTDSLLVEDSYPPYYLFAPNPNGGGNIRANFEYHEDCDSTFLRICHFPDDDLHINPDEDIVTPVCDGFAAGSFNCHLVDSEGNLIFRYVKAASDSGYDVYWAQFDSDGTLKRQSLLFEGENGPVPRMGMFKENPLQYYQWRDYYDSSNLAVDIIDSLLRRVNIVVINEILSAESLSDSDTVTLVAYDHFSFSHDTEVIPVGGDDILLAAQYISDTNFYPITAEHGVAVAKYDVRTHQREGLIMFNDYPGSNNNAQCLGLRQTTDGSVYFLYQADGYPQGSIIVVKMDVDLNVEWKRVCKTDDIVIAPPLWLPILYEDEQGDEIIAWAGYGRRMGNDKADMIYFFLTHDGIPASVEDGLVVRPYTYYPNPAKDVLHLQFSPDVTPTQIDLYDLQGRLVQTQRNGLETLEMSGLAAGTYTMRVTMQDGQAFSDKVVKE